MTKMLESLSGQVDVEFFEYDRPPVEPLQTVRAWVDAAIRMACSEPLVMSLATSNGSAEVSMRMMATSRFSDRGLVFATHANSRKGRDISATKRGCALYYWREIGRQMTLAGTLHRLEDEEANSLWYARNPGLHTMTSVSRQSEILVDPSDLREKDEQLTKSLIHRESPLPRPASFVAFELVADSVEFWSACSDRMHKRLRYEREEGSWGHVRLQP